MNIPKLPLGVYVDHFVQFLNDKLLGFFNVIGTVIETFNDILVGILAFIPAILLAVIVAGLAYWASRRWGLTVFTLIGLLLIINLGYWEQTLDSLALVLTSVIISMIIGIPLGIWCSQSDRVSGILSPILDFMQTMPAFVYLIPAILFFGIGVTPGIIASVIFAMPPTIRLTNLGIRQVPEDLVEASNAFGSTTSQKLFKVQLPLATGTIMAGVNQSIMLALSMVVIASLVGAPGLGVEVYRAVQRIQVGLGFEAGIAIVILAIILDRITQSLNPSKRKR
ncbi:proline/glycine betaine ABC transporter permease [Metabacillus sp. GX 13764]|uniref:ABC transporter permease n=1 Tax=Metabacillus kandeliae TaxID=2900151 RepID=UPI001E515D8A|nr:proline/glycine betaine ABC transporter permease [Metabacillus kandeliae]MCD7035495.1 proline/glycine betaine ABC transporter permease [Metabacillus kandeliae]